MSNDGCFTFITHHFVLISSQINPYVKRESEKFNFLYMGSIEYKKPQSLTQFLSHLCMNYSCQSLPETVEHS